MSELDGQLQEMYDGVSEYLIAVQVMQTASTRVAQTFSEITNSKDPQLKVRGGGREGDGRGGWRSNESIEQKRSLS